MARRRVGMLAMLLLAPPAAAETWRVGPGRALAKPSAAAALVQDGDSVIIDPATYYDCAVWNANRLTIEAAGQGVLLTDTACQGKAAFVIRGDDVTIAGLAFARIRVADGNGAGIRAEGGALTVRASRFSDTEVGILAATGTLRVIGCVFERNGVAPSSTTDAALVRGHDIAAGRLALLRVEESFLGGGRGRAAIESNAARTELVGNRITGAAPLVSLTDGGAALLERNTFTLAGAGAGAGAITGAGRAAVLLAANGDQPAGPRVLRANILMNEGPDGAALIRDWSGPVPILERNVIAAGDHAVVHDGAWRNAAGVAAHRLRDGLHEVLRGLAAMLRRAAAAAIGWSRGQP